MPIATVCPTCSCKCKKHERHEHPDYIDPERAAHHAAQVLERTAREEQLRESADEVRQANERLRAREMHKNPAVAQLATLRKRFAKYENVRIERVGGENMSTFQVWVDSVPAKSVRRGIDVTVQMKSDQLRSVKGDVNIGANELTAKGVKKFLSSLGIKA